MATPAMNANHSAAVDKLTMMFPTIERPTIQNIVVNECRGDTTKSIVILSKIQQFNQNMNSANANDATSNVGEAMPKVTVAVTPQRIPLQVIAQPTAYNSPNQTQDCCDNCCGTNTCVCCSMKPASYRNGLYRIDYKIYNLSFLFFSLFSLYPDTNLYFLGTSYHGLYLPIIGLSLLFISSCFFIFIGGDDDVGGTNTCGSMRGSLFIFGGLFYLLGYMIHAATVPDDERYYWWYHGDIYPEAEYLVGRGLFVGVHAIFIGYLYVTNNRTPKCLGERVSLVRFWTLLFLVYQILVLYFQFPYFWAFVWYSAFSPVIIVIALLLNCCLIKKSNEAGGCNSGVTLGLIIVISYYFELMWFVLFVMYYRLEGYLSYIYHYEEPAWAIVWDLAIFMFGSMQLWILSRAMHPVNANCGCVHDGTGDGNISAPLQTQPQQVVTVIQQHSELQPIVVIPTAAVAPMQKGDGDDDDPTI